MAHSLFEPAPKPLAERFWRRVIELNLNGSQQTDTTSQTAPELTAQVNSLDARGRQQFLQAAFASKPIK
ncbi:hypothetical protein [uncultured Roseibium sp.]|uniref:hypothetical protein n=1 Tax=uncultured Roseibium sp. TaxID=1936171 RepID=UPI002630F767|nr:hypothetical protein [uncultured Roseibium sp.]